MICASPRVGDVGTKLVLHITDCGEPVDLAGTTATIELRRPRCDMLRLNATTDGSTVVYIGQPGDNLWPRAGDYAMRAVVQWPDGRRFTSEEVQFTVD